MRGSNEFPFFINECIIDIQIPGGIINPLDLNILSDVAIKYQSTYVYLGQRQNMYFIIPKKLKNTVLEELKANEFSANTKENDSMNITSSLATIDIFGKTQWATEGIFQEIVYNFDYTPQLKINIVDINQSLVPLFNGELNFISSPILNYWFLYFKNNIDGKIYKWNDLVYSTDVSNIAKVIEKHWKGSQTPDIQELLLKVKSELNYICLAADDDLKVPRYLFSYYEGMTRYDNKYWLGIYRRKERFRASVLKEIAQLLQQTNAGSLYLTPWKNIIIKNIQEQDRIYWEILLGKNGYNNRHSCTDLIWKTPDLNRRMYKVKKSIVQSLDMKDVRTFGLTIGLKTDRSPVSDASILIEEHGGLNLFGIYKLMPAYSISYSADFNPNNPKKIGFLRSLAGFHLPASIKEVCKMYYDQLNTEKKIISLATDAVEAKTVQHIHECSDCGTIYDPEYGDLHNNIPKGTSFDQVPSIFECPVCGAAKDTFVAKEMELFV